MEESESINNNYPSYNSSNEENDGGENNINSCSIRSFISKNYSNKILENSNNLEDIIFKELEKNKKSYLDNGIYFKRKIEGSNPNTKRGMNNSLFDSNLNSETHEKNNISRSDQLYNLNKHSLYKSFIQSGNILYSPNKNYIPNSESEEDKENNNYEENESSYINFGGKNNSINIDNNISIRISNPKDINNYNSSKENSNQLFNSQKELISSLKNGNLPIEKRFSIINNFSKLNSLLCIRNTISYLEKPNYQVLAYTLSNNRNRYTSKNISIRSSINASQNIDYSQQARIIQSWWRNIKVSFDDKLNKIIKIQSVWRGKCSRKYIFEIIYLCYSCQTLYDILSKIFTNKARKLFLHQLFLGYNKNYNIIYNAKKLFNRYQYVKPFFEKWKCINKLMLFQAEINRENYITKKKINIRNKNKNNEDEDEEYYNANNRNKIDIINEDDLKILYLNSIYLKLRMNKIRYVFDCLYYYNYNYNCNLHFKKESKFSAINGSNECLKKYFLYKWRNIVKNLETQKLKEKLLNYLILKFSEKTKNNILSKYLSRWKLFTSDKRIIKPRLRSKNKKKNRKNKKLKALIKSSIKIKKNNYIIFIRALIRKWRFLVFAKKMAHNKILKMYEIVQKTYGKISEDIYDIDKKKLEKYQSLNKDKEEDEKNFIEHLNKIYNLKMNNSFKYDYNNNKK